MQAMRRLHRVPPHRRSNTTSTAVGVDTRDERGAVSTEMAVVIAAMVAIAVVLGAIFIAKARSNANNIPDTVAPPA